MNNKVTVNIYGKEFTVSGDKPAEQIMRIATHVDLRMKQIGGEDYKGALSSLAILTAMNISEEYFDLVFRIDLMTAHNRKSACHKCVVGSLIAGLR